MSNYTGYRCPVCGKAFEQGDDVVVCPDCGTPHHRACYRSLGHCIHEDKHSAGQQWSPEPAPQESVSSQATVLCPRCGSHNPAGNIFCQVCSYQLTAGQVPGAPFPGSPAPDAQQGYRRAGQEPARQGPAPGGNSAGLPQWFLQNIFSELEEGPELSPGISRRDVCDFVGPNGYLFLMRFQQLMEPGPRLSVNWSAFLFSFFYCFYRKMYRLGAVLLGIVLLSLVPVFVTILPLCSELIAEYGTLTVDAFAILNSPSFQQFDKAFSIFMTVVLTVNLFCGFFFNKLYCRRVFREIRTTQEHGHFSSGSPEYHYALAHRGGVNTNAVLVAVCTLLVLYILAGIGLSYQFM